MKRTRLMSQNVLLRIWRTIMSNPQRVFVMRDFRLSGQLDKIYLDTLIKLGFVEKVQVIWRAGCKKGAIRSTAGYRAVHSLGGSFRKTNLFQNSVYKSPQTPPKIMSKKLKGGNIK